jgi:hypothetical protein
MFFDEKPGAVLAGPAFLHRVRECGLGELGGSTTCQASYAAMLMASAIGASSPQKPLQPSQKFSQICLEPHQLTHAFI